jgi:UDP-glucose 6-dehydrogenase
MKHLIITFTLCLASATTFAGSPDSRHVLEVTEPQRAHVLEEMRALLSGVQNILTALSKDDMVAVAQYARPLGMSMAHKAEDHLKGVLPREFMRLGMSVHEDFDRIAVDAESVKDPKQTLRQLSNTMFKCVACHDSYQLRTNGKPANQSGAASHHEH